MSYIYYPDGSAIYFLTSRTLSIQSFPTCFLSLIHPFQFKYKSQKYALTREENIREERYVYNNRNIGNSKNLTKDGIVSYFLFQGIRTIIVSVPEID